MRKLWVLPLILILSWGLSAQAKFGFEISGSYLKASPEDFNLSPEIGNLWVKLVEGIIQSLYAGGKIVDLQVSEEGELGSLEGGMYLDGRLKVAVTPNFAISLGAGYISMAASGNPKKTYTYDDLVIGAGADFSFDLKNDLKASALIPGVALHLIAPSLGNTMLGAEVWAGVGYIMAKIESNTTLNMDYSDDLGNWEKLEVTYNQDGSGNGLSYSVGGRLNVNLASNVAFFLGAEYIYAKLKGLKGKGDYNKVYSDSSGTTDTDTDSWTDSEWFVGNVPVWGTPITISTNYPHLLTDILRSMELDLSGIRVIFGFSILF